MSVTGSEMAVSEALIDIVVNGEMHKVGVQSNWTLQHVLHNELGLTGSKDFCDRGVCGSCAVIIEGRAVLACMTLAIECDGKIIETIEGISQSNHPLIDTYIKHHCMQCGYCTPGFIVTAKALLDRNRNPNEDEIKEALSGNICRCATYPQHAKAVLEAAKSLKEE